MTQYISEQFILEALGMSTVAKGIKQGFGYVKKNLGGSALAAGGLWKAKDLYKEYKYGHCKDLSGIELRNCRLQAIQSSKNELNKQKSMCNKATDPKRCLELIKKEMDKLDRDKDEILTSEIHI